MRIFLAILFSSGLAIAQQNYLPLQPQYYHWADRYEVLSGSFSPTFHSTVKPFKRQAYSDFLDSTNGNSKTDSLYRDYLRRETWECNNDSTNTRKPFLKFAFARKSDFYSVNTENFDLHVNPVVYFSGGQEKDFGALSINSRGLELRGTIDKKVGFYTFFTDNQALLPSYVSDYRFQNLVVPGEGYNKIFKTRGVDFISARGYIHFGVTKHIEVQFGHDRHFIGNGYRSLILSDFANSYNFLKLNTRVWKFNYTNIFAEMVADYTSRDELYPKKYMAFHHLSLNIGKHVNIGVFESVALRGRSKDSTKFGQFDIGYLNPVIFYRSIEQQIGSFDNAMLGIDWKVNFLKHFSWYGQIVLDEFLLNELKARNGWWANKQGLQTGLKYFDVAGIKNLDMQGEMNYVRPYMYAHKNYYTSFTHYNQAIAHPLGANFTELIGIVRYQPHWRIQTTAKAFLIQTGLDTAGSNWGSNIHLDYATREQEYGNKTGQGVSADIKMVSFQLSYMLFHNCFLEGYVLMRDRTAAVPALDQKTVAFGGSLRWNIAPRLQEF